MSWQLDQERGIKTKIDMPPAAEQPEVEVQAQPEVAQEHAQEEVPVQQEEEQTEEQVEAKPEPQPKKIDQAKNFRELKEQKEMIQRERDELMRRLQEAETAKRQEAPKAKPKYKDLDDEDIVEGKHLKKYDSEIEELRAELNQYKQQTTLTSVESRLKNKYPDIDTVVSKENLEALRATYPELADSVNANPDLYNKAAAAYTLIKKLGIATEDLYVEDKQKAQKNAAKPRPLASVSPQQGDSPLSKANAFANGLTDDLKAQLRREMEDARKNM